MILGAGVMQGPAIRIARELGFFTVVLDGSSTAPCVGMADRFERIDLKDKEGIEAFARTLRDGPDGLGGIMTAGTDFSATVAWVAEKLGLPGIPYETALNASDKGRMRSCFRRAGLPSPHFITITAADGLAGVSLPAPFPLVIKPVDNMGGRGCRKVNGMDEFQEAAAEALRFSGSGRAIVEAFMEGPEFSVDAIVYRGEITICGLADRHIFFPPFFIEMGHTMPSGVPADRQKAILDTFCAGVRALGLVADGNVGAAKGDIKLTPAGPMIGEIAARLSGGYMSGWTYPYSSGVEPVRAAILAAMGRPPECLVQCKDWTSAERAFISIPGTVKSIVGADAVCKIPYVRDLFLRSVEGEKVSFPEDNVSKCGNVISDAPDRATAVDAAESAVRAILIRLDPADSETQVFLQGCAEPGGRRAAFPPDAFDLPPRLSALLSAMPETRTGSGAAAENRGVFLVAFPEFAESGLTDYAGRSVADGLEAVRRLTGLSLPEICAGNITEATETSDNDGVYLGKSFWAAFARGSYQGAVYCIDRLLGCR